LLAICLARNAIFSLVPVIACIILAILVAVSSKGNGGNGGSGGGDGVRLEGPAEQANGSLYKYKKKHILTQLSFINTQPVKKRIVLIIFVI
jgi:hypothetical protein